MECSRATAHKRQAYKPPGYSDPYTTNHRVYPSRIFASNSPKVSAVPLPTQKATIYQLSWLFVFNYRSEEHTSELQSRLHLVCRLLLEKKKKNKRTPISYYTQSTENCRPSHT